MRPSIICASLSVSLCIHLCVYASIYHLCVRLHVCLRICACLCICLCVHLCICVSLCIHLCISVRPSVCPSAHPAVHLSVHPSLYPYVHLCISLHICVSACASICLCIHVSTCASHSVHIYASICMSACDLLPIAPGCHTARQCHLPPLHLKRAFPWAQVSPRWELQKDVHARMLWLAHGNDTEVQPKRKLPVTSVCALSRSGCGTPLAVLPTPGQAENWVHSLVRTSWHAQRRCSVGQCTHPQHHKPPV